MEIDLLFWLACLLACWLGSTPILGCVSVPIDLRHLEESHRINESVVWTWLLVNPTRSPVWTLFGGAIKKEHLAKTKRNSKEYSSWKRNTHLKWNTHIIKRNPHIKKGTLKNNSYYQKEYSSKWNTHIKIATLIMEKEHSYYQKEYSSWNTHTIKRNTHHQNGTLIGTLHM